MPKEAEDRIRKEILAKIVELQKNANLEHCSLAIELTAKEIFEELDDISWREGRDERDINMLRIMGDEAYNKIKNKFISR